MKTMHGNPITVLGKELQLGEVIPNFTLVDNQLGKVSLDDFNDEYLLISIVPSLDTGVCDFQTRTIDQKLSSNPKVKFITVSMDLPFAQKRWCGANGLDITTLSDYQTAEFGLNYGVLIEELRLLARTVLVVNKKREVIYKEYLDEMTNHPNYDKLVSFVEKL